MYNTAGYFQFAVLGESTFHCHVSTNLILRLKIHKNHTHLSERRLQLSRYAL